MALLCLTFPSPAHYHFLYISYPQFKIVYCESNVDRIKENVDIHLMFLFQSSKSNKANFLEIICIIIHIISICICIESPSFVQFQIQSIYIQEMELVYMHEPKVLQLEILA